MRQDFSLPIFFRRRVIFANKQSQNGNNRTAHPSKSATIGAAFHNPLLTPRLFRIQSKNRMSTLTDTLRKLSGTPGPSGHEEAIRAIIVREFQKLTDTVEITPLGSVVGVKRAASAKPGKRTRRAKTDNATPRLLVEAHMDEIGLIVTAIQDGFIRFEEIGFWDPRTLPSQNVLVHGRKTLPGVIGMRPPHVVPVHQRKHALAVSELFIDVGMSEARVRELVRPGDTITLDRSVNVLQNEFLTGKAFDDRSGLATLIQFLRRMQNVPHAWDIYAVANVNEEDSPVYLGAQTSAYHIRPQIALCLDVTHAQQAGLSDDDMPEAGKGPGVARGANIHPFVFEKLRDAAQRHSIPHQVTVYGDDTQTNAWMMQITAEGIPTGLIEIPLRYMHSSVETIALSDLTHTTELLYTFAAQLNDEDARALQGETFVRETARVKRAKRKARPARPNKTRRKR